MCLFWSYIGLILLNYPWQRMYTNLCMKMILIFEFKSYMVGVNEKITQVIVLLSSSQFWIYNLA